MRDFIDRSRNATVLVEVASAKGSTPRDEGAWMLVSADRSLGTIGGGQLEFMAIDRAREMLATQARRVTLDIPLGPEIGQCCGGRVEIALQLLDHQAADVLIARVEAEDRSRPHVYLFGGGHVGRALAASLALLPLKTVLVETRADAIEDLPVETLLTAVPEAVVREAPSGAAFVMLTHDHALDFLIVAEALKRGDAAYVGMIGSATKKASFRSWFRKAAGGEETEFARLVCPIGAKLADKRPAVIAALAAAEIMAALDRNAPAQAAPAAG